MSTINTENFIFCKQCEIIHSNKSHVKEYTENEVKTAFLMKNFNLTPTKKNFSTKNGKIIDKNIKKIVCKIKLEKMNLDEYLPLSKIRKYQDWKKKLNINTHTIKLNRIKLIWDTKEIKFVNATIEV